jgi:hypothetical protein
MRIELISTDSKSVALPLSDAPLNRSHIHYTIFLFICQLIFGASWWLRSTVARLSVVSFSIKVKRQYNLQLTYLSNALAN